MVYRTSKITVHVAGRGRSTVVRPTVVRNAATGRYLSSAKRALLSSSEAASVREILRGIEGSSIQDPRKVPPATPENWREVVVHHLGAFPAVPITTAPGGEGRVPWPSSAPSEMLSRSESELSEPERSGWIIETLEAARGQASAADAVDLIGDRLGPLLVAIGKVSEGLEGLTALYELLGSARSDTEESVGDEESVGEVVELESVTGAPVRYTLPVASKDMYRAGEVGEILSPSSRGDRTIAQARREASRLLGVKVGNQYRYPKFQIDVGHKCIVPVVEYANQKLEAVEDPWGTLSWWYSALEGLDGRSPERVLEAGELSESVVDELVELGEQAMD